MGSKRLKGVKLRKNDQVNISKIMLLMKFSKMYRISDEID
jgi:hypothetical protein